MSIDQLSAWTEGAILNYPFWQWIAKVLDGTVWKFHDFQILREINFGILEVQNLPYENIERLSIMIFHVFLHF